MYVIGKKNFGSYDKPRPSFSGTFTDWKPDFYKEYLKLKNKSMEEALDIQESKTETEKQYEQIIKFKEANPHITYKELANGYGISDRTVCRIFKAYKERQLTNEAII